MKTERRHELQTNVLADWLGDQIERLRPYARLALGIVLAVAVVLLLYTYLSSQSARQTEKGFQEYFLALDELNTKRNPESLTRLAESSELANTPVGHWAQLSLGDNYLRVGVDQLFNDRAAGIKSLHSAIDEYAQVAKQTQQPMLADRATMGMARAYESLNDLEKARAKYDSLAKGSGAFSAEAQQRLKDLGQQSTKQFYDWFFATKPPRSRFSGPGIPGDRPNFGNLPDERLFQTLSPDPDKILSTPSGGVKLPGDAAGEPVEDANIIFPGASSPEKGTTPDAEAPAETSPHADAGKTPAPDAPSKANP